MKRLLFTFIQLIVCLGFVIAQNADGNLPFTISLDQFASGFSSPIEIANAGDNRLFIVERSGRIKILNEDGTTNGAVFLDINDRVINSGGQSEQGLLALEFHPEYAQNGFFFVHYSDNDGNTVISRFEVDPNDANLALADSEEIIYTAEQPFTNHNGGSIKFGQDGMLYIGLGDGGAANDPQNLAQNTLSPMGKMLRIDVDNGLPYTIPSDNPFINDADVLDEIWSLGHRNPWKWSFDRLTGDMWIADVGQNQWEEINLQLRSSTGGENYGWRCREGAHNAITSGCNGEYDDPVAEYNHLGFTHCSVTGGYVYRGLANMFQDAPPIYLFTDYCSGSFWGTYQEPNAEGEYATDEMNRINGFAISTFGEDINGELYVGVLNNGRIYKVNAECNIDVNLNINAASCGEANDGSITIGGDDRLFYDLQVVNTNDPSSTVNPEALAPGNYEITISRFGCEEVRSAEVVIIERAPLEINFDNSSMLSVSASGVSYQWFLDEVLIPGANTQTIEITQSGNYSVIVTEESGCVLPSDPVFVDITSIQTIESIQSWELVPNPVEDILTMTLNVTKSENFKFSILDAAGKLVESRNLEVGGDQSYKIDMDDYVDGVYLLILSDGVATQSKKVVKQ